MKQVISAILPLLLLVLSGCGGGGGSSSSLSSGSPSSGTGGSGPPLLISTTTLPVGLTDKTYTAGIAATGGYGKLNYGISTGSFFPLGLSLDPGTGAISGTVTGAVFGDVTFRVTDSGSPQQAALKTIRMTFNWSMSAIAGGGIPAGHTNVPYQLPFYADGSNGSVSWSVTAGQLPTGLVLTNVNSTESDLVGTPTNPGTYNFTLQVVDSSMPPQTATVSSSITVDNHLAIATVTLPVPYVNEAYSQTVTAVNGAPPYHWSAQLPSFLTIDAATGTISGTGSMGNYWGTVTVTDSSSPAQTATQTYTMLILPRLAVTSGTLPDAHVNQSYSSNLSGVGGQGNVAWSVTSGSLPPGLKLQPQYGILSGTPTQLGSYTFSVQLQDSSSPPQVAQGQFTIVVRAAVLALQPSLPQRIPINVPFEGVAATSGGTLPITWNVMSGLPPGLSLDPSTGRVSGTPTVAGQYSIWVGAVDSSSPQQSASYSYNMTVGPALGRNDSPSTATPLGNGGFIASISPLLDPPTGATLSPDSDYYRITGVTGGILQVNVNAITDVFDPVLELVDANGARLNNCRYPGITSNSFVSPCVNDDVNSTTLNSQLEYRVPGTAVQKTDIFAHVLDWRGDARPDMTYSIFVSGAFVPIVFQTGGAMQDVAANHGYSQNVVAQGGSGTLTGAITAGQPPPGVSLVNQSSFHNYNGSGDTWTATVGGNPTTAGMYTFTITVTDQAVPPQSVSQQFTVHVFPQIQLGPVPDQILKVGQTTTFQGSASGGVPPLYFFTTGWSGVTADHGTGLLTFQPAASGQFSFMLWVQGSGYDMGTEWSNQTVNVTVNP